MLRSNNEIIELDPAVGPILLRTSFRVSMNTVPQCHCKYPTKGGDRNNDQHYHREPT